MGLVTGRPEGQKVRMVNRMGRADIIQTGEFEPGSEMKANY